MNEFPPIANNFSTLIASREFELSHNAGIQKVIFEIGLPVNDVETVAGFDWRCPVRMIVGNTIIIEQVCGSDSVQALSIAIGQFIKLRLKSLAQEKEAKILFYGEEYNFEF